VLVAAIASSFDPLTPAVKNVTAFVPSEF